MKEKFFEHLQKELQAIRSAGLYKEERIVDSPQSSTITLADGRKVLNFCANNYLGLANHPRLIEAAKKTLDRYGYGLSSVRFICGTQTIHIELERRLSEFLGTEATILYSSCFDANGGLFETIMGQEDAIISDSLNHASIIDGIRLTKSHRYRFESNNMADLEAKLKEAQTAGSRFKLIATDGVFSMDGVIANLHSVCNLADKYGALTMIDDCHATGFVGKTGRGSHEHNGVMGRIDLITGTLGKALGGASGGYISGKKELIDLLRQRSRPYLFSNSLAPPIVGASLAVFDILEQEGPRLREQLKDNSHYFRVAMQSLGFELKGENHPIIPILLKDAALTQRFAKAMLEEGIYVIGFFYPVVAQNQARIRTQMSAAHSRAELNRAIAAFEKVGRSLGVI